MAIISRDILASNQSYSWEIPSDFFASHSDEYCPAYINNPNTHYGWDSGDDFKIFIAELKSNGSFDVQDQSNGYFSIVEECSDSGESCSSSSCCSGLTCTNNTCMTSSCNTLHSYLNSGWSKFCGNSGYNIYGDIDNDGDVDIYDLDIFTQNFKTSGWCQNQLDDTTDPCGTSLKNIENQLASIAETISNLLEEIKNLIE